MLLTAKNRLILRMRGYWRGKEVALLNEVITLKEFCGRGNWHKGVEFVLQDRKIFVIDVLKTHIGRTENSS